MKFLNLKSSKAIAGLTAVTITCTALISFGIIVNRSNNLLKTVVNADAYSLMLDTTNAPTDSDSFVNVEHHNVLKENNHSAFSYSNVKALADGHCVLAQNGVIVKDEASHHLNSLTITIGEGKLQIETGFAADVYNTTYLVDATGNINVCGNYIKITALEETALTSMKVSYSCFEEATAEGHNFGTLIEAANGVPAHYECADCGVAFNEAKTEQIDATLYQIRFFDGDKLYQSANLGINSPVVAPSGTFRTFYNILGFNAKVDGAWGDELLTSIPNVTSNADYRIVKELKEDATYLLSDLSDNSDVLGSSWDSGANIAKANVDNVPAGAALSEREQSVRIGTRNGIATIKIGPDFFYAVKNNAFEDTDFIQVYANFPVYAGGSKYNDVGLLLAKSSTVAGGLDRNAPTTNEGSVVYYNGGTYWIKQVIANGGWQQLKIYVSELKAMLAGVPETNETEFDSIVLNGIRNAASPASSTCPREVTLYDVEFHRVDISKDFIINDCTNLSQIKAVGNTAMNASNLNTVGLYDTTVPINFNSTDYPITKPTTSLKKGDAALSFVTGTGGWEAQCALDISFIVDNIDKFADTDKIVVYAYGFNNYGDWLGVGGLKETNADGGGINMTTSTASAINTGGSGKHRAFNEATITIAQLKALTALSSANTSGSYTHDAICKTNWLNYHVKAAAAGTTNLIYSVELHHAS